MDHKLHTAKTMKKEISESPWGCTASLAITWHTLDRDSFHGNWMESFAEYLEYSLSSLFFHLQLDGGFNMFYVYPFLGNDPI